MYRCPTDFTAGKKFLDFSLIKSLKKDYLCLGSQNTEDKKICARSSPQTSGDVLRNNQKLIKTVMMQYMQAIQIGDMTCLIFSLLISYLL